MRAERESEEDAVIHRSRCAIAGAVARLKTLGLYGMVDDGAGRYAAVDLDPAQRRELLVFLSEFEELVGRLDRMKAELARDIERTSGTMNASATYQRTGASLRRYSRQGRQ